MISSEGVFTILVAGFESGKRLDVIVSSHLSDCSRSYSASLISDGKITVDGKVKKPGYKVRSGDFIQVVVPPPEPLSIRPEPIEIEILFEDKHLIVVNKQPGIVVHPAPGHYRGTLVNALLHHCPELGGIGGRIRPGIVHRLDKDTSGALVIAKSDAAHHHLALQFKSRQVKKKYLALVLGKMDSESGMISLPIGRHPIDRKRMSTVSRKGRQARTRWRVSERFPEVTLLELDLQTGRTHQIRVHCAAVQHPIVGDPLYCSRRRCESLIKEKNLSKSLATVSRQMLHAWRLQFLHPATGKSMPFEAPLPADMAELIERIRNTTNKI